MQKTCWKALNALTTKIKASENFFCVLTSQKFQSGKTAANKLFYGQALEIEKGLHTLVEQGCQIFLGTAYQKGRLHQKTNKCT
jgi:predicted mannosyl-3-phosphoglycerate phosphatase (HAD superfamily)